MMNDSRFPYRLNRKLYETNRLTHSALLSRTSTLTKNAKLAVSQPLVFTKKAFRATLRNPRKIIEAAAGSRMINKVNTEILQGDREYAEWVKKTQLSQLDIENQKKESKAFEYRPLISLVTPVYNPPLEAHDKLIKSVVDQTYDNFELLLYNFSDNDDSEVTALLDGWAKRDSRIIVKHGLKNNHISANSNRCLEDANGEYLGLLDHDDALTSNALYECIKAINEDPKLDFIYTDKDKISENDIRFDGFFKPDWSPEMVLGGNYLTHFNLMRTKIVKDLGGWNPELSGAQDWDIFLRITERTNHIKHIPKIVYHWRTVVGSTAGGVAAKPYALKAQQLTVKGHLERTSLDAEPYHDNVGQLYIKWKDASSKQTLIVIHSLFGDYENSHQIIEDIRSHQKYKNYQIRIITPKEYYRGTSKRMQRYSDMVVAYEQGELTKTLRSVVKDVSAEQIVYIKDSISSVRCLSGSGWMHQLVGWLTIKEVSIAGGISFAENGQLVDMGSLYNSKAKRFERLFYASGYRSGYVGYIQWIRNLIMVSEQLFAFEAKLLFDRKLVRIRDDELASGLSLVNLQNKGRAVYDPVVMARDKARDYLSLPNSDGFLKLVAGSQTYLRNGDPYLNPYLTLNMIDPKPRTYGEGDGANTADAVLRALDTPRG